eukprot:325325-Prymnesium_polylepis.1
MIVLLSLTPRRRPGAYRAVQVPPGAFEYSSPIDLIGFRRRRRGGAARRRRTDRLGHAGLGVGSYRVQQLVRVCVE